jgi:hypothetical protein
VGGREGGYFSTEDEAVAFEDELKAILVNQLAAYQQPGLVQHHGHRLAAAPPPS